MAPVTRGIRSHGRFRAPGASESNLSLSSKVTTRPLPVVFITMVCKPLSAPLSMMNLV